MSDKAKAKQQISWTYHEKKGESLKQGKNIEMAGPNCVGCTSESPTLWREALFKTDLDT